MEGWIKIHRAIQKHWIYKDSEKLKAWICILIEVNHEPKKVLLGGSLFECNRGDSLNSLDTWARLFGGIWNKSKVRRFLKLLENDSMIVLTNESKTTRLTVCNYDGYQGERNDNETQVKRKRNASETLATPNKNDKELKNEKNDNNIYRKFAHLKISIEENSKLIKLGYNQNQIDSIYDSIENYKKNTTYKSLFLTSKKWLKKEYEIKTTSTVNINDIWKKEKQ